MILIMIEIRKYLKGQTGSRGVDSSGRGLLLFIMLIDVFMIEETFTPELLAYFLKLY